MSTLPKVLLVDDEPFLLEALERSLEDHFDVRIAQGGSMGLGCLKGEPDVSVVVSDMRMPGMDGAEFLSQVPTLAPHATRILLTGQTDLADASRAVNRGGLFRFLLKPCPAEELIGAIDAGVRQHDLIRAEQDLLERTLKGAVQMLTEVLQLTDPAGFGSGLTAKRVASHLAAALELPETWIVETAALVASLGKVALAEDLVDRARIAGKLSTTELNTYRTHPAHGGRLLRKVPRMEQVAELVEHQLDPPKPDPGPEDLPLLVLQVSVAAADLFHSGTKPSELIGAVTRQLRTADRRVVGLLEGVGLGGKGVELVLRLDQLRQGMILSQDVRSKTGTLLAGVGLELNLMLLERLHRFHERVGVEQPIRVRSA